MSAAPAMDREAFHHLLLNAGCLAEQALVMALQGAVDAPSTGSEPGTEPAAPGLQARPEDLDWGALDGLSLGNPEAAQPAAAVDEADEAERAELSLLCALGPPDVYEAAAPFAARLDRLMARADQAQVLALLAALPADAAPLTSRLTAADFERWCGHLTGGSDPLQELVSTLRSLDPPL